MFKVLISILIAIACVESASWRTWNSGSHSVPAGAFRGGWSSGRTYYVIRGSHSGGLLPGKYSPDEDFAYVSYNGHEINLRDFQILIATDDELTWENANTGRKLVVGGTSGNGDTLHICRFDVGSALVPGKLHNSKCYVPQGGKEHSSGNWATLKFRYS